jgi:hypothetical protein
MDSVAISIIRTIVPVFVGAVASWLSTREIDFRPEDVATIVATLTAGFTAVYYLIARTLERRWPKAGFLLLIPAQPKYTNVTEIK